MLITYKGVALFIIHVYIRAGEHCPSTKILGDNGHHADLKSIFRILTRAQRVSNLFLANSGRSSHELIQAAVQIFWQL